MFRLFQLTRGTGLRLASLLALLAGLLGTPQPARSALLAQGDGPATYENPLKIAIPGGGKVENCAEPSIIYGQTPEDRFWYMYCASGPLNSADEVEVEAGDTAGAGTLNSHLIPILRSKDLVSWEYMGDVFSTRPAWVASLGELWAPDIRYIDGQYVLYYSASWTGLPGGGSAIGAATAPSPTGPWEDAGSPVVEPSAPGCCELDIRWTFDPAVVEDAGGQLWIYFGSYFGGISARKLSADGLKSDPESQAQVAISDRYEGSFVTKRGDFYYLFVSAGACCQGPWNGSGVFVGRSTSPTGPFVDQEGVSLLDGRAGGTPLLTMNGNRWAGPGEPGIFTDFDGQDWIIYQAADQEEPYFEGAEGLTRQQALIDRLDWVEDWPVVRGGMGASDTPQPAPAAQPGEKFQAEPAAHAQEPQAGALIAAFSDEFESTALSAQWSWIRAPEAGAYRLENGALAFDTQAADLYEASNDAAVLLEDAPDGPFMVEVKVGLDLPAEGCCYNDVQGGLVIYGGDDNYLKLAVVSSGETRQTAFAKEAFSAADGFPRYGSSAGSAPGEWTYLRITRALEDGEERYTAYTSRDGENWFRGGTWTHDLGGTARIGLISMGGSGFTSTFEYVRVYRVQ